LFLRKVLTLLFCLLLCQGAGIIGAIFTNAAIPGWYLTLVKPAFMPPNWVFAPVWTLLYTLLAITLYLIITSHTAAKKQSAYCYFIAQLALNVCWTIAFFGNHSPGNGLLIILALWLTTALTMLKFRPISPAAAWLLIPYLAWITFASLLNISIWKLNG
jgi:tryptophan-rich sensory protein